MSEAGVRLVSVWVILTIVAIALAALSLYSQSISAQETGFSLRMYGNGVRAPGQDRVLIPIDNPERPADIGATDFTIEFWIRVLPDANRGVARCNENDGWIYGSVVVDRDMYGGGDYGDWGVSVGDGRIVFGVSVGNNGTSLCSNRRIDDGEWHHVAATRRQDGAMQLFINGALAGSTQGSPGNASYRNNRSTNYPADPFIVLGAEKHDAGAEYPSFNGWLDDLHLSNTVRYSVGFARPTAPFVADSQTVALYHFDEGPVGACTGVIRDSSGATGGPSDGQCVFGGSPAGPEYAPDTPFTEGPTPTATPTSVATATNTSIPLTATNTATTTASSTPAPATATNMATATASSTPAPPTTTNTATATASSTPAPPTATNTATNTLTPPMVTNTATATTTDTLPPPAATDTMIPTLTSIPTVTDTPIPILGGTIPMTPPETPVGSATDEVTPTLTPTLSPCPTMMATPVATPDTTPVDESIFDALWSLFFPLVLHEDLCVGITR